MDFTSELTKDLWIIAAIAAGALLLGVVSLRNK